MRASRSYAYPPPMRLAAALATALWLADSTSVCAAGLGRFAGNWVISSAVAAPWAKDPKDPADEADAQRLIGKPLEIGAGFFRGPQPLGCNKPTYAFRSASADTMFEGSLNADGADKPTDPVVVARALHVSAKMTPAMTASCSEVEFLLIDPNTMLFGLNNRVFSVTRAK
jgi:hypothetical protein